MFFKVYYIKKHVKFCEIYFHNFIAIFYINFRKTNFAKLQKPVQVKYQLTDYFSSPVSTFHYQESCQKGFFQSQKYLNTQVGKLKIPTMWNVICTTEVYGVVSWCLHPSGILIMKIETLSDELLLMQIEISGSKPKFPSGILSITFQIYNISRFTT